MSSTPTGAIPVGVARPGLLSRRTGTGTRSSRRAFLTLGTGMLIILGAIAFLAYQGLSDSLVYYITPSELKAKGPQAVGQQFTLGGQVKPGSLVTWNKRTHRVSFILRDSKASVPVVSRDVPPPMLVDGSGAVVQGTYAGGFFHATNLMVKHNGTYVAPKNGHAPKDSGYAPAR